MQFFSVPRIFTGDTWLEDYVIGVDRGIIQTLNQVDKADQPFKRFEQCLVIPALIDVQVYGAAGKLFSLYPGKETLDLMNREFLKQGTVLFLPTIATNTREVFRNAIDAVRDYWQDGGKGVHGLHFEGPWLNAGKRGAHVKEWIHVPSVEEVKELMDYGKGVVKMVTIAPEACSKDVIDLLRSYDVIVSAGHSNATYQEAMKCFEDGVETITHLFNAMSALQHREPGLVGAAMNHHSVKASIIPDGHHVDFAAISIAKKIMGSRLFAITDAVTGTDSGPYRHELKGDKYECNGVLSGSALSMHKALVNLVNFAGVDLEESIRMCSLYPAQLLGCDDHYAKIAPGYAGQLLVLNQQLEIVEVII
ncbi:MAG TPA: N-acetylglucosamine-6-phosphate deacetylase [Flavisolibacter sp.]